MNTTFYAPVSSKGQVVIPAQARKLLNIKPQGRVKLVVNKREKQLTIEAAKDDPVAELHGMFSHLRPGYSLTKSLERRRRQELKREQKEMAYWSSRGKKGNE